MQRLPRWTVHRCGLLTSRLQREREEGEDLRELCFLLPLLALLRRSLEDERDDAWDLFEPLLRPLVLRLVLLAMVAPFNKSTKAAHSRAVRESGNAHARC
jgi:hypothetical protein